MRSIGGGGPLPNTSLKLRNNARNMRQAMTPEEVKLWVQLRHFNARGFHFRRQVPLDGYILDFAEFAHRLIIEIDGSQHGEPDGLRRDDSRDAHFIRSGFRVLRFWNIDINTALDGAVLKIEEALKEAPSGAPRHLPRKGGG
jgi:very-short-patch-repair endonuclease